VVEAAKYRTGNDTPGGGTRHWGTGVWQRRSQARVPITHSATALVSSVNCPWCRRADGARWVRVTHPFHPLRGQRFALLSHRHGWGEQRVRFRDGAGRSRSLPEERAAEIAARTLALPDAQRVEDCTARPTSAGEC
jgi:hypothetical protein